MKIIGAKIVKVLDKNFLKTNAKVKRTVCGNLYLDKSDLFNQN